MNKYNAKKVRYAGYIFDSKVERLRYIELRSLEQSGQISGLEVHPKFVLQPSFSHMGKHIRAITYTADFKYTENKMIVVEDVKGGKATMTEAFNIRWKIVKFLNPHIVFKIVKY